MVLARRERERPGPYLFDVTAKATVGTRSKSVDCTGRWFEMTDTLLVVKRESRFRVGDQIRLEDWMHERGRTGIRKPINGRE